MSSPPEQDAWHAEVARAIGAGQSPSAHRINTIVAGRAALLGDVGAGEERQALEQAYLGLGPLAALVSLPDVTDVVVNGDGRVFVDRGQGLQGAAAKVPREALRPLAVRLAGLAGRRLDDAQPWVDGQLAGGIRLHAVLPPICAEGAHISVRVARHSPAGVPGLRALQVVGDEGAALLEGVVRSRASFVVIGGTGSGKTTLLGGLLAACPTQERLVLVEDVAELIPNHPHVVRLQGRSHNVEGRGEVTLVDLVRQSLRMRPDRLVVGEVRGPEVRDLLLALNTSHTGGGGTIHANGAHEVVARFEALGSLAGMPREAVHAQLRGAFGLALVMARDGPVRRLAEVAVLDVRGSEVRFVPAAALLPQGVRALEGWPLLPEAVRQAVPAGAVVGRC